MPKHLYLGIPTPKIRICTYGISGRSALTKHRLWDPGVVSTRTSLQECGTGIHLALERNGRAVSAIHPVDVELPAVYVIEHVRLHGAGLRKELPDEE